MKICHLASGDLWAGAEVQIATFLSYLVRQPGVEVSAIILNEGKLANELRNCGIKITIIQEEKISSFCIFFQMLKFFRKNKVDILHTHRYKENILGSLAAKIMGVPCLVRTVHGLPEPERGWQRIKAGLYSWMDSITIKLFSNKIIAVSMKMCEVLERSGYDRKKMVCIYNAVNLEKITSHISYKEMKKSLGIDSAIKVIGTVGRLTPVKGHEYLIKGAKLIREKRSDVKFLLIGAGPLENSLKDLSRSLGLEKDVLFLGEREDVCDLITAMDIFVFPSMNEGIPMAILEAMAISRPIVATAVGGIPEIIRDGFNGILVGSKDEKALANACIQILENDELAGKLGQQAKKSVHELFSHERNARMVLNLYDRLFEDRQRMAASS